MIIMAVRIAYILSMFIQGSIVVKIVLMLAKADMTNQIASLIVKYSDMFVVPFSGIADSVLRINGVEIPATLLVALAIYIILSVVCSEIIKTLSNRS